MQWLIYGAGNIGSLYAARLAESGQDVTVLARGKRLDELRERGIELEDVVSGKRTSARVGVVERLEPSDAYDHVLVVLPKHALAEVLPILAANEGTPSVMFFGNNAAGPSQMIEALGRERVLLGFPGAAAVPRGPVLRYVITSVREQPTTIGELDGRESPRIVAVAAALQSAGFPVAICPKMDAWLKTHVAKILPTVGALFHAGGEPHQLAASVDARRLMVRSIREGYRVLRANGVPITPSIQRIFEWIPEFALLPLIKRMLSGEAAAIKVGHAGHGRAEWQRLAREFRALIDLAQVPTPSLDVLYRSIDAAPGAEPSPDEAQPDTPTSARASSTESP